ncbi:GGDEF domain-containing protein [Terrisporobacter hibernicus]|uniref:GGDEF domain-containing protein n=1 Tax=Terrisporobacter hibernicus TaxID=2813371 RepID=A0AAX2ZJK5_9FIRM|nr:GGDEF domain-containing protein [Terrisporobacter hibernicus]UEL48650.1 GGDEF domain-containing protein [Terrisporobacter hibernicus]
MLKIKFFDEKEDFLQSKNEEYKNYTLISIISLSIACFLFFGWDYIIDPQGSKAVFLFRVLMLLAPLIYYIPHKYTDNYKIISISVCLSMFYILLLYLLVVKKLENGVHYSINGFIVYNLSLVTVSHSMPFKYILGHQVLGFVAPVILDLLLFKNTINYNMYMLVIPIIMVLCTTISYTLYLSYYEKYELQKKLKGLAFIDNLTQCYNRAKFYEIIHEDSYLKNINNLPICIMLIDIDDFKKVNDKFGHKVGDIVLQQVSECMKKNLREKDSIFRWGGEEFLILLPNINYEEGSKISKTLVEACNEMITPAGRISISIGYGEFFQEDIDSLIIDVDKALYKAKSRGKNQSCPSNYDT